MTKFDDPAGRVKIQTRVKIPHQLHILLHTKTCNKLFIAQLLYFKDIFQKVGKATQIEKCTTRSQPIKQVFFTVQNNQMYNLRGNFYSIRTLFVLSAIEQ